MRSYERRKVFPSADWRSVWGSSYNGLAAYEKGKEMPSFLNVVKLCRYFNVPLEYFVTGKEKTLEYNDIDLVDLFSEIDKLPDKYRGLVKTYAGRIIEHADSR